MVERTLTYRGSPRGVALLAQMLREEGVEARYTPPLEQRDLGTVIEVVVIYVTMKATDKATDAVLDTAVKRALARFRERAAGRATVEDSGDGS